MTRLTVNVPAGPYERYTKDVALPKAGQNLPVNMPDGTQREGTLVSAERIDDQHLRITVDV